MGKPIYIKTEKFIKSPIEVVWDTVAEGFGSVQNYNPNIKSARIDSTIKTGIGTIRHCDFEPKGYIKEEITTWEDQHSFELQFTESSVPMAYLKSKFTFIEQEAGTKVIQEFWYRMKAPMGWMSGLMKNKMKNTLITGLEGLNNYLNK